MEGVAPLEIHLLAAQVFYGPTEDVSAATEATRQMATLAPITSQKAMPGGDWYRQSGDFRQGA